MTTSRAVLAFSLAALAAMAAPVATASPADGQDPDYAALWSRGQSYDEFRAEVQGRERLWARNTASARVPEGLLRQAQAVGGEWRLLVVAYDRCSDSVSNLPYLAALADAVPGLELRIIQPDAGRSITEAHRTADGRAATPTALLLTADWDPVGAWVERPAALQALMAANPDRLGHDALYDRKMAWYEEDAGMSTMLELVELLESASPTSMWRRK
jgi:hypothetical protein